MNYEHDTPTTNLLIAQDLLLLRAKLSGVRVTVGIGFLQRLLAEVIRRRKAEDEEDALTREIRRILDDLEQETARPSDRLTVKSLSELDQ